MKSTLLIVPAALLLMGAPAGRNDATVREVRQAIGTLNDAFAKRDADAVRRLMTDEHVAITPYYRGPQSKAEQLKSLTDLQLTDYKAGELKLTLLTDDAVLVTYPLTQAGKYKQKPLAPKNYVSAVWVKRTGAWQEASYQETPLDPD